MDPSLRKFLKNGEKARKELQFELDSLRLQLEEKNKEIKAKDLQNFRSISNYVTIIKNLTDKINVLEIQVAEMKESKETLEKEYQQKLLKVKEKAQQELKIELDSLHLQLEEENNETKDQNFCATQIYVKQINDLNRKVNGLQAQVVGMEKPKETLEKEYQKKLESACVETKLEMIKVKEENIDLRTKLLSMQEEYVPMKKYEELKKFYEKQINNLRLRAELNLEKTQKSTIFRHSETQTEQKIISSDKLIMIQDLHEKELDELRVTMKKDSERKLDQLRTELLAMKKSMVSEHGVQTDGQFFSRAELLAVKLFKDKELEECKSKWKEETKIKLETLRKELEFPTKKINVNQAVQTIISADEFEFVKKSTFVILKDLQENSIFKNLDRLKLQLSHCLKYPMGQDHKEIEEKTKTKRKDVAAVDLVEKRPKFMSQPPTHKEMEEDDALCGKRKSFTNALDLMKSILKCSDKETDLDYLDDKFVVDENNFQITCKATGEKISLSAAKESLSKNYKKVKVVGSVSKYMCLLEHKCNSANFLFTNKGSVSTHIFSSCYKIKCLKCDKVYNLFGSYVAHARKCH